MIIAPAPAPAKRLVTETLSHLVPEEITLAIDTEFYGTHPLTVQAATRIDAHTLAVQVYHSDAIPTLPHDFSLESYLPPESDGYGRFCRKVILQPARPLTPDLSPALIVKHLFGWEGLGLLSRPDAQTYLHAVVAESEESETKISRKACRVRRELELPELKILLVGHFLTADLGRIFGRDFLRAFTAMNRRDSVGVVIRSRKFLELVEERGGKPDPVLEYLANHEGLCAVRVQTRDTIAPFGRASLNELSKTFLGLTKSEALTEEDKRNMLRTFRERTHDAYGYAVVDAVNTLLVNEQMEAKDRQIYRDFQFGDWAPPFRSTLGSRVSTFITKTTQRLSRGAVAIGSGRALEALMAKGGMNLFTAHPQVSKYGAQTGRVQGGLLSSRSPTRFWHEAPGRMRDVDMSGCYNKITTTLRVHWGRPVIFEPGQTSMTLRQAVELTSQHADADGWLIRLTGDIRAGHNALIPSTDDAVTSANYRVKMARGKNRKARQRAFYLESLRDPTSVKGTGASRLYSGRVESGIVTWATWRMIQALPPGLREDYERLTADSIIFYPKVLAAETAEEFDALIERYRNDGLPWEATLSLEGMELVQREKIDAEYVSLTYPLGEYATQVGEFREEAQQRYGKGSGSDLAWKVHANSMYGVLASSLLPTNNFLAGNQITAHARAAAFAMNQALNAIQTITDGCTCRIDQIPACSYAECLRIKPDYPTRRAEAGDGIPFLDPESIPTNDADFTIWYREHVKRFFGVSGADYDRLIGTHVLVHKKTGDPDSVAFDALACDGSANYAKCARDGEGWKVEELKARSYGRKSKERLQDWIVKTYSTDRLTELAPVTEDTELLSFKKAAQKARKILDSGVEEIYFPLGLEFTKVMNYRALKVSAFVFRNPGQRGKVLKAWKKFETLTGAGLEALTLRRSYGGRREGSLKDLAESVYAMIEKGGENLSKILNLYKKSAAMEAAAGPRWEEIKRRKREAERRLREKVDVKNLDPEALPTAFVVRAEDIRGEESVQLGGS